VVGGGFEVLDSSRRNRNFKVLQHRGPCYFVKQGADPHAGATIAREAAIYRHLGSPRLGASLGRHIPKFHHYDPVLDLLIVGLSPGSESVDAYAARTRRIPAAVGGPLGAVLAALHRTRPGAMASSGVLRVPFDAPPPWILQVHRPRLAMLESASETTHTLIRMIQQYPEIGANLSELSQTWLWDCLIHGDLRSANYVVRARRSPRGVRGLQIVDWELACIGDPAWDVGCVLADFLALWVSSMPLTRDGSLDLSLRLARFPLARMTRNIRAFWDAYVSANDALGDQSQGDLLFRSIRYAAARLLQRAYEKAQFSPGLTADVVCMVQLSLNLVRRAPEAAHRLFGLTLPVVTA
jgi:hypothetical protein